MAADDARRFTGGVSGVKMRQVICLDEGRQEVGSKVGRGAALWVQNPDGALQEVAWS